MKNTSFRYLTLSLGLGALLMVMAWAMVNVAVAQAPTPGDIAVIAYNVDGDDDLAFVVLRGIEPGTQIFFTDDEWNGTAFNDNNEGTLMWENTTGANIDAGTVISMTDIDATSNPNFGVNLGTLTSADNTFNMSSSEGPVYFFTGSRATPSFLAAIGISANSFDGAALTGTGLVSGTTAINMGVLDGSSSPDGGRYDGARTGQTDLFDYIALLNNSANWTFDTGNGENLLPFDDTAFTGNPTAVSFETTSANSSSNSWVILSVVLALLILGSLIITRRRFA